MLQSPRKAGAQSPWGPACGGGRHRTPPKVLAHFLWGCRRPVRLVGSQVKI